MNRPMNRRSLAKAVLLSLLGFVLSLLTFIFSTPFFAALYSNYGRWFFWLTGFSLTVLAGPLWILIAPQFLIYGVFRELEDQKHNLLSSGLWALLFSGFITAASAYIHLRFSGYADWNSVAGILGDFSEKLSQFYPGLELKPEVLVKQVPGLIIAMLMLSLINGMLFEKTVSFWFNLPSKDLPPKVTRANLLEFNLPEGMIWGFLLCLLVWSLDLGVTSYGFLGVTGLYFFGTLYLFQGLAVLEVCLRVMRAGAFIRVIVYVFIVGQFFFLLSILGLLDYWLDFRTRLKKSRTNSQ